MLGRYSARDQKRTFGDAIVQGCSRPPARPERCLVTDGTPTSAPGRALGCSTSTWERPPLIYRARKLSPGEPASEEPRFSQATILFFFSFEQRPDPSSFRQASRHTDPTKLPPSSAKKSVTLVACTLVSHRSRMLLPPGSELGRFGPCRPSEGPGCDSLENVEQDRGAKSHRRCRTSQEVRGTKYHSRYPFRSSRTSSLRSLEPIGRGLRRS